MARFAEANFGRVSNKSGFLMGIIRRVQQDGPDRGNEDLDLLPRSVRYRMSELIEEVCLVAWPGELTWMHAPPVYATHHACSMVWSAR